MKYYRPPVVVHYEERMEEEQVREILRENKESLSPDAMILLRNWFYEDENLHPHFVAQIEGATAETAEILVERARIHGLRGETERQWLALQRADVLRRFPLKGSNVSIRDELKAFNQQHPDFLPPMTQVEILQSFGIQPFPDPIQFEVASIVALEEPVKYYKFQKNGNLILIYTVMLPQHSTPGPHPFQLNLHLSESGDGGYSAGYTAGAVSYLNINSHQEPIWDARISMSGYSVMVTARYLNEQQFLLTLSVQ
jgi:hypothetical protein